MRRYLKTAVEGLLPARAFVTIQSIRSRNYQMRLLTRTGHTEKLRAFVSRYGPVVLHGPFKGMRYPEASILSRNGFPMLLGTYELELHEVLRACVAEDYELVVDVGSAEGYYAVGLARLLRVPVYAFDTEPRERQYCKEMAAANGVSELVRQHSWCTSSSLRKLAGGKRALIVSDCEGFETELFSVDTIADLARCDLLVELHDSPRLQMHELLSKRLAATHTVQVITYSGTGPVRQELEMFGSESANLLREMREAGQKWIWAAARGLVH